MFAPSELYGVLGGVVASTFKPALVEAGQIQQRHAAARALIAQVEDRDYRGHAAELHRVLMLVSDTLAGHPPSRRGDNVEPPDDTPTQETLDAEREELVRRQGVGE
jgi:hypothetical protein